MNTPNYPPLVIQEISIIIDFRTQWLHSFKTLKEALVFIIQFTTRDDYSNLIGVQIRYEGRQEERAIFKSKDRMLAWLHTLSKRYNFEEKPISEIT